MEAMRRNGEDAVDLHSIAKHVWYDLTKNLRKPTKQYLLVGIDCAKALERPDARTSRTHPALVDLVLEGRACSHIFAKPVLDDLMTKSLRKPTKHYLLVGIGLA